MLKIDIPGQGVLNLEHLVLDYNGTLAKDGLLLPLMAQYIKDLAKALTIYIITADTFGSVKKQCQGLPAGVIILKSADHTKEKGAFIKSLTGQAAAFGNGANDCQMLSNAALGVLVMGPEGCAAQAMLCCDVLVTKIDDAFALLLNPGRLTATLRR